LAEDDIRDSKADDADVDAGCAEDVLPLSDVRFVSAWSKSTNRQSLDP